MKHVFGIALSAALCIAGNVAFAQPTPKPEDVIKFRQGAYTVIGWYMGELGQMVKGQRPFDQKAFAKAATVIAQMSHVVPDAFLPGSDKGKTHAKPEIWQEPEKFKDALSRLQTQAAKLSEVAQQGNQDQMKTQFGTLAKACKNCHDQFRSK